MSGDKQEEKGQAFGEKIQVIDQQGNTAEEREYATWADLCEPRKPKEVQLQSGKWVKYVPWIPADKMAEIQRKASKGRREVDAGLFMLLVLQEIMIEPKIKMEQDRRAAMKADSAVVLGIVSSVTDVDTMDKLRRDLGEA